MSSCVVFDLDDTLFLERDYVRSGFTAVARALEDRRGPSVFLDQAWEEFERGVRGRIFDNALEQCGITPTPDLIEDLVAVYRSHEPALALLPDAAEVLAALRSKDDTWMGVVSDGPMISQRAKADAIGAHAWSQLTVLTDELPAGSQKPSAAPFRLIEDASGFTGPQCIYVADNPAKDFSGPKSLGWSTLRIRRPLSIHESVASRADVDSEVVDLTQYSGW